jgi:hypothetical protein
MGSRHANLPIDHQAEHEKEKGGHIYKNKEGQIMTIFERTDARKLRARRDLCQTITCQTPMG